MIFLFFIYNDRFNLISLFVCFFYQKKMYNSSTLFLVILTFICINSVLSSGKPWDPVPGEAKYYQNIHQELLNQTKRFGSEIQVVFLGSSSISAWTLFGNEIWKNYYQKHQSYNYGVWGDRTENILWRIENGELDGLQPKLIVLEIGHWNIAKGEDSSADIAKATQIILKKLLKKLPNTKILLISIIPCDQQEDHMQKIDEINNIIKNNSDNSKIFYLDVAKYFRNESGKLINEFHYHGMTTIDEKGYEKWHEIMKPMFEKLLQ
uniref:Platelet-activating factor acetylhydrolase IB subunit beta homolog n=1 Tax=Dermatophagoides pteronyssinus TaxID=6956 RepID=A0A6P6XNF2_DERPT|nr:platelet-activating factor acetylhydrolase IB subunit beta homolog [Dermatophagoides pteronyssinus]